MMHAPQCDCFECLPGAPAVATPVRPAQLRQNARRKARKFALLGRKLNAARLAAGLTQELAAERANASSSFISQTENGYYCPSIPLLCKLAAVYGTTVSAILEGVQ